MPQRDLKELQKLIAAKRTLAFRDAGEAPPELRNNIEMAKNAAKQDLAVLLKELDEVVYAQGVIVGIESSLARAKEFVTTFAEATEKDTCFVDADECYAQIAEPVWDSLGKKKGTPGATEVALAIGGLRSVAVTLGIMEFQRPDFAGLTAVYMTDLPKLVSEIKRVVRASGGETLAALYVHRKAVEFVTDKKIATQAQHQVPIFVANADAALLAALDNTASSPSTIPTFAAKHVLIKLAADEQITKTSVLKLVAAAKKAAKA